MVVPVVVPVVAPVVAVPVAVAEMETSQTVVWVAPVALPAAAAAAVALGRVAVAGAAGSLRIHQ